jgi:hypothetical protein
MGFGDRRRELLEDKAAREARDEDPGQRFEYLARNLDKVAGMALEDDLNKHGAMGWEAVCEAKGYLVFKRQLPTE